MKTLQIKHGAYLPHWTREDATYHITFRLADSLPAQILAGWKAERDRYLQRASSPTGSLSPAELQRVDKLHSERIQSYLDNGRGECLLAQPEAATTMQAGLARFHEIRYRIFAWRIMPNHVHVVVRPLIGTTLSKILHNWKGFSARQINRQCHRQGTVWQTESYDHLEHFVI